jgi:hypothetical protein
MLIVVLTCLLLVVATATVHYEALRLLAFVLPKARMPVRPKVIVVVLGTFVAHAVQILLYGFALFVLVRDVSAGVLSGPAAFSLTNCLYFSAETFTSLGFGDITPKGPVRLLAGVEALNGLLLIGWSASFIYLAMEQFWRVDGERNER